MFPGFKLRKWYFDCISESGDTAIIYCAEAGFHRVRLRYSSFLAYIGGELVTRTSLSQYKPPASESDSIRVDVGPLGVDGTWHREADAVERTLYTSRAGDVRWTCMQPKASARVEIAGLGCVEGFGYAECLTLTLPPWRLPLQQLRWGRFLSASDSLVWIDWRGPFTTQVVIHNGVACAAESISDTEIKTAEGALRLELGVSLRSGRLGKTIVPAAPALRRLFPSSLFEIDEQKWRSRGTFTSAACHSPGWAVHEVVHWNV